MYNSDDSQSAKHEGKDHGLIARNDAYEINEKALKREGYTGIWSHVNKCNIFSSKKQTRVLCYENIKNNPVIENS
jgi:hypothetical protein